MSTRQKAASRRAAKSASVPKVMRCVCSECGAVHPVPTGKKCAHVLSRELFPGSPVGDTTAVCDRTSTPKNDNTSGTNGVFALLVRKPTPVCKYKLNPKLVLTTIGLLLTLVGHIVNR